MNLAQFAGTWQAEYKGKAFFTLKLKLAKSSLGGTCVHSAQLALVNGELLPNGDEVSTGKILETSASGKKLLIKIGDDKSTEVIALEFTLTTTGQAEGKIAAEPNSEAPAQEKPWQFRRIAH